MGIIPGAPLIALGAIRHETPIERYSGQAPKRQPVGDVSPQVGSVPSCPPPSKTPSTKHTRTGRLPKWPRTVWIPDEQRTLDIRELQRRLSTEAEAGSSTTGKADPTD